MPDFWYWLNYNTLVSSEGITILQKSFFHILFSAIQLCFCSKGMKTIHHYFLKLFLLIMPIIFLLQDNAIVLFRLKSLYEWLVFHDLSYVLKHKSSLSDGKFILFSYFIYKRFKFCYFCGSFFIFSWFNATVTAYWKHFLSFSLMEFIAVFLLFIQSGKYIWSTTTGICFVTFIIQKINTIEDKLITFHWF